MTLNIQYEVTLKSDTLINDDIKSTSYKDSLQHTSSYSSNQIPNVATKRLDFNISPTTLIGTDPTREITLNLEELGVHYIKIMHIKSLKYFMFKFGQSIEELDTVKYEKAKVLFRDYGDEVSSDNFVSPSPQPKFIRFLNPATLNGAGDTNNKAIGMITVSLVLITSHL